MAYQSEAALEQQFIEQLNKQGYDEYTGYSYPSILDNKTLSAAKTLPLVTRKISLIFTSHHGSSKPGNLSFGRFSRPLLEVYNALIISPSDNICGGGQYD